MRPQWVGVLRGCAELVLSTTKMVAAPCPQLATGSARSCGEKENTSSLHRVLVATQSRAASNLSIPSASMTMGSTWDSFFFILFSFLSTYRDASYFPLNQF